MSTDDPTGRAGAHGAGAHPADAHGADAHGADAHPAGAHGASPAQVLDCRGQRCPLPVIKLAGVLPRLPVGDVLRVLADDPAAANDIPAWCRLRGQEFVGTAEAGAYDVRRSR